MRFAALSLGMFAGVLTAADWPAFRGGTGAQLAVESGFADTWTGEKNVAWHTKLSGRGWASPIVVKDKIYLASATSTKEGGDRPMGGGGRPGGGGGFGGNRAAPDVPFKFELACYDLSSGKELWKKLAVEAKPKIPTHGSNTYASETPASDGERIYVYYGMNGFFCFDLDGKELWKKDLGSFPMMAGWGTSSSPVAGDGRVFVQVDNEEKSFLVAFDGKTGDELWREKRSERSCWASPILWKNKTRTELVTVAPQKARSYDPATGKLLWELTLGGGRCSASPVADENHVYVGLGGGGGGFGGGGGRPGGGAPGGGTPGGGGQPGGRPGGGGGGALFAVKAGASGDITPKSGESKSDGVVWSTPKAGPPMASPLVYKGYIYVLEQQGGMMSCYDAATGKPAYQKERVPNARTFWASPWGCDGKIFCMDDSGVTHVVKAGPSFEMIGKNALGDSAWATPALVNNTIIIRGVKELYAIKQ